MPAHASRTLAPASSAPPSRAERRLLAPARPRHRPANARTPPELSGSPASRPIKLRSVDSGLGEIRNLRLEGPALRTRLEALRERYRLSSPDDVDLAPSQEPQVVRIVCSDGLV